jgi:hypothetical protein
MVQSQQTVQLTSTAFQLTQQTVQLTQQTVQLTRLLAKQSKAGASTNAEFYQGVTVVTQKNIFSSGSKKSWLLADFASLLEYEKANTSEKVRNDEKFVATESNMVQPIWSAYLGSGLDLGDGKTLTFDRNKRLGSKTQALNWVDTHSAPSIGSRKPDEVQYCAGSPVTVLHAVMFGDIKGPGEKFSDEDKGQILTMAIRLLELQPGREFVYTYLRNSNVVQFFRVNLNDEEYVYKASPELMWAGDGGAMFASMLISDLDALGWVTPNVEFDGVSATAYLGSGLSCTAYATDRDNTVVKIFKNKGEMKREVANLKLVNQCVALLQDHVTQLQEEKGLQILVSPLGRHYTDDLVEGDKPSSIMPGVATFGRKHIGQLIDVVEHSPLVHRDLHPANIYIDQRGNLVVNDWALAMKENTDVCRAGVDAYLSTDILSKKKEEKYTACHTDDLHAVICIVYRMLHPHDFKRMENGKELEFWQTRLNHGHWKVASEHAANSEYAELKSVLNDLIPW